MKRLWLLSFVLLVTFLAIQGLAYAESVSGKVASVDATAGTVSISRTDPVTGAEEELTISVPSEAAHSGVASLGELASGDQVTVEAEKDLDTGSWSASSVAKS